MVNYQCDKCNKIFNQKIDFDRHIKRKNPCVDIDKIKDTKNIMEKLDI